MSHLLHPTAGGVRPSVLTSSGDSLLTTCPPFTLVQYNSFSTLCQEWPIQKVNLTPLQLKALQGLSRGFRKKSKLFHPAHKALSNLSPTSLSSLDSTYSLGSSHAFQSPNVLSLCPSFLFLLLPQPLFIYSSLRSQSRLGPPNGHSYTTRTFPHSTYPAAVSELTVYTAGSACSLAKPYTLKGQGRPFISPTVLPAGC